MLLVLPLRIFHLHYSINNPSYVVFGLEDLDDHRNRRDGIPISVFIPHPRFSSTIRDDIALIRLARPVRFSDQVRPACFGTSTFEPVSYRTCRTAGFGGDSIYDFSSGRKYDFLKSSSEFNAIKQKRKHQDGTTTLTYRKKLFTQ